MENNTVVYRTFDKSEILEILRHPAIIKTIAEGNCQDIDVNPEKTCFIACKVDNELSAVFIFDKLGAATVDVHAHVLPAKRQHSKDIGAAILRYFFDIAPWAHKLTAIIPICYPNVIAYAHQFGFINEGVNRRSYALDGVLIDQIYLGATQQEVLNELC